MLPGFSLSEAWKFVDGLPSPWNRILEGLIVLGVLYGLVWALVGKVEQGTLAMKQRFGKVVCDKSGNPLYFKPGRLVLAIRGLHTLVPVGILKRQIELDEMPVDVAEYRQVVVKAIANFNAVDIHGIKYSVEDLEPYLSGCCEDHLRESVMQEWRGINDVGFARRVKVRFETAIAEDAADVGAKLSKLNIKYAALNPHMAIAAAVAETGTLPEPAVIAAATTESPSEAIPVEAIDEQQPEA